MTAEEIQKINEALFDRLASNSPLGNVATVAINNFTRWQMYHRFTGMPKRGFARRIFDVVDVKTREEWLATGVSPEDLIEVEYTQRNVDTGEVTIGRSVDPWWHSGKLFYEIAEERLAREDYEQRLAARTVPRYEYESHARRERRLKKEERDKMSRREAFAYSVMADIVGAVLNRKTTDEREQAKG